MTQDIKTTQSLNKEDIEAVDILVRSIITAINKQAIKYDQTFKSVVKAINSKGYVILDQTGVERTVKCAIPSVELSVGTYVWVKIPMGNLNQIHICGKA